LIRRIRAELGQPAPVVATGGLAGIYAPELDLVTAVDPLLTLEGLRLIWQRNRK
jgi:type III pantothenate kinase